MSDFLWFDKGFCFLISYSVRLSAFSGSRASY